MTPLRRLGRAFATSVGGSIAVEFALVAPMLLVLLLGGVAISGTVATWRKLCDTTAQLGNVTAQFTSMQADDAQGVLAASAQVMSPFSTAGLKEVMTLITVDNSGNATVTWSQAYNGGAALAKGSAVTLPTKLILPGMSVMSLQATYPYTPLVGAGIVPSITMSNQLYTVPRSSGSIPCSNC